MDKRKAIAAYRHGLISMQECAQILGIHNVQHVSLLKDPPTVRSTFAGKQSVR